MSSPRILMCPPTHYGIEYEINAWMNRARQADNSRARSQWEALVAILQQCGTQTVTLEPSQGVPDLVFTANAALVYQNRVILANFRHPQRQTEQAINAKWFIENEFEVEYLPEEMFFEGAGDALFCGDTLFAGYRFRSHARAHQQVGSRLGARVIPVALVNDYYYHLDTCFCPISRTQAIYYPGAFDNYGITVLQEHIPDLIEVSEDEAQQFACNAVVVGTNVVTNVGCPELHKALQTRGFQAHATPLDEFVKSGGSAKCLTLRLDGEEAADWTD
ncbi:MAG: arginine deiminase-related protein [Planctomycetota bacterium]